MSQQSSRVLSSLEHQKQKILVVDDEDSIRYILETRLATIGYNVVTAADGQEALDVFRHQVPDLIILDVMMPKLDGFTVCQALRKESSVPIIMLTAIANVADRITGLELGADDYIVKPFSPNELESRIRCILRRVEKTSTSSVPPTSGVIQVGSLRIDTNKRQVYKDNERIRLTYTEFSLLEMLVRQPGKTISRSEMLEKVWGYTPDRCISMRVVDVHMSRLRDKLQGAPNQTKLIVSIRRTGYVFQPFVQLASK